jgi:putative transposase
MTQDLDGAPRLSVGATFARNHTQAILACDFFLTVTASFRILYVFAITEVGSRSITHFNVTAHPTADWTLQQFPGGHHR